MILTTAASALPGGPNGFQAKVGVSRTVQFSWELNPAGDSVTAYRLYALDSTPVLTVLSASAVSATATGLTNGEPYRFYMTALNSEGESAASTTVTAVPLAAPVSLIAQRVSADVVLSWSESDTPSGAHYLLYTTDSSYSSPELLTSTAQLTYTHAGLESGNYYYLLSPTASGQIGQILVEGLTLTASSSIPPPPPDFFRLIPGNRTVEINWLAVGNATTYNIYRTTTSGFYGAPLVSGLSSKTLFYVDSDGLTNTVRYYYAITSVNDSGESTRTAEGSVIPFAASVLPADPRIAASQLRRDIYLEWSAAMPGSYPLSGYNVYRSEDGGGVFTLLGNSPTVSAASTTLTVISYADVGVDYGKTFVYRVHPLDRDSVNNIFHEGPAYPLARVSIVQPANRIEVFRNAFNPVRGEAVPVRLTQVQPGRTWIKIFNLAGERVRTLFDQDLPPGYTAEYPFVSLMFWDGKNNLGEVVACGVYLIHAEGQAGYHQTRKVAVIK